jgi:hypothetical protein
MTEYISPRFDPEHVILESGYFAVNIQCVIGASRCIGRRHLRSQRSQCFPSFMLLRPRIGYEPFRVGAELLFRATPPT